MKQKKIKKRLEKAIKAHQICKVSLEYNPEEECKFLPIGMSENLVYMVKDGDPVSHGYSLRCIEAIKKVKVVDGTEISAKEIEKLVEGAPKLDITDWASALSSLGKLGHVVVAESEKYVKKDGNYAIGKLEKIGRKQIVIRYYGPDSAWENKKWKIPYEEITRVSTASLYTEELSKYVPGGEAEQVNEIPDTENEE